jgi:hypothetical protein
MMTVVKESIATERECLARRASTKMFLEALQIARAIVTVARVSIAIVWAILGRLALMRKF